MHWLSESQHHLRPRYRIWTSFAKTLTESPWTTMPLKMRSPHGDALLLKSAQCVMNHSTAQKMPNCFHAVTSTMHLAFCSGSKDSSVVRYVAVPSSKSSETLHTAPQQSRAIRYKEHCSAPTVFDAENVSVMVFFSSYESADQRVPTSGTLFEKQCAIYLPHVCMDVVPTMLGNFHGAHDEGFCVCATIPKSSTPKFCPFVLARKPSAFVHNGAADFKNLF